MRTIAEISEKFTRLAGQTVRRVFPDAAPEPVPPRAPDPAVVLAASLGPWSSTPEAREFLAWLRSEARRANAHAHDGVGTAQGAWWLGAQFGFEYVAESMEKWIAGQPAGIPPARPASAGG